MIARRLSTLARLGMVLFWLALAGAASARPAMTVGFQEVAIANADEPPLKAGIWYPSRDVASARPLETFTQTVASNGRIAGSRLPLVVISHGGGGSLVGHYDTALALARAGFVVAAISHAGDMHGDESQVLKLWRRPMQMRRLVTFMLSDWRDHARLDPHRIGMFGFSNGGFTALVAAGAVPDLGRIDGYCRDHPDHDLCIALKGAGVISVGALPMPPDLWVRDPRIEAIAVAAPAFGFTFDRKGLSGVRVPVALWRGADDRHQPDPWYEAVIRAGLPVPPDYHVVPDAGHYDFLAPCSAMLAKVAPAICTSIPGFDRAAFHRRLNASLVRFFTRALGSGGAGKRRSGDQNPG